MGKVPFKARRNFKFCIEPSESTAVPAVESEWAISFIRNASKCNKIIYRWDAVNGSFTGAIQLKKGTTERIARSVVMEFFKLDEWNENHISLVRIEKISNQLYEFCRQENIGYKYIFIQMLIYKSMVYWYTLV